MIRDAEKSSWKYRADNDDTWTEPAGDEAVHGSDHEDAGSAEAGSREVE